MFVVSVKTGRVRLLAGAMAVIALLAVVATARTVTPAGATVSDDAARRSFLQQLGYEAAADEAAVREITIPTEPDEAYTAYQALQQAAGYDLTPYRGRRVKCWQYTVTNYPGHQQVEANLYIYDDKVIGGDISSTAGGFSHGLTPLTADG